MSTHRDPLAKQISSVLANDNCTGCGVCALVSSRVQLREIGGYTRPVLTGRPDQNTAAEARTFGRICPGRVVRAVRPEEAERHPFFGPIVSAWQAWAEDPAIRWQGSSGGTLTAIATYLSEVEGQTSVGAAPDAKDVSRTVSVRITSREEALQAAGSRYAPCSTASATRSGSVAAVVGRPCEATALRALEGDDANSPYRLSFFCAGVPNQNATSALIAQLGFGASRLADLWYRGRGWPGFFTVKSEAGTSGSLSYDESWGSALGPTVQWRCRVCPDGVGESADITAGDFWNATTDGKPDFDESDGRSVLIARTRRGYDLVLRAAKAGYLHLEPVDLGQVLQVQQYHKSRRELMAGRLIGQLLAGSRPPTMRGFGLLHFAFSAPRRVVNEIYQTWIRRRIWDRRTARS